MLVLEYTYNLKKQLKMKQIYAIIVCALVLLTSCTYEYKYPETSNYKQNYRVNIAYSTREALTREVNKVMAQYFAGVKFSSTNWNEEIYYYDKNNQIVTDEPGSNIVKVEAVLSYQGRINYYSDWIEICAFHFVKEFDDANIVRPSKDYNDNGITFDESSPYTLTTPTQSLYEIAKWHYSIFRPLLEEYGCRVAGYDDYEIYVTEKDKGGNVVRKERKIDLDQAVVRAANTSYVEIAFKLIGYDNQSYNRKHLLTCKLKRTINVEKIGIVSIMPMPTDEYDVQAFVGARYQVSADISKRINSDLADNGYNPYSSFDIFVKELDENKNVVNSVSLDNYSYTSRWYRANEKAKYVQFVIDVTASKQSDYYNRTKFRYIFADLKLKDPKYITKVDLLNAPFTKKSY